MPLKITFISLFPQICQHYFEYSILKRAQDKNLLALEFVNPRDFSTDKHQRVDDYTFGEGAGLLLAVQAFGAAIKSVLQKHSYVIFPTPAAKPFKQQDAIYLSQKQHLIIVCGRYEGFDERLIENFADATFSLGDFVLTGGELAALNIADAVSRNVYGVLGNTKSLEQESFSPCLNDKTKAQKLMLASPSFTRPQHFHDGTKISSVPELFLKGNHAKISALKNDFSQMKTKYFRPDLYIKTKNK